MQNSNNYQKPLPIEKIIAVLSYCTAGIVGFVWFLIGHFMKLNLRPFLKYHIYQSIFISVLFSVGVYILDFLFSILARIPFIKNIVGIISFIFIVPIIGNLSLLYIIIILLALYLCVGVLLNRYSYIPWVSNVIKYNIGRG